MKLIPAYLAVICLVLILLFRAVMPRTPARLHQPIWLAQIALASYINLVILAVIGPRGIALLYAYRPNPPLIERQLFQGIDYTREAIDTPEPMVIHIVRIDLDAPGIRFLVTPSAPSNGHELRAQTTSAFLASHNLQLAINADFFEPWWDISPLDYSPHVGEPVNVLGFASSEGHIYSDVWPNHSTIFISETNHVTFDQRPGPVYNAVSGGEIIVQNGAPQHITGHPYLTDLHPRTAVGLDQSGRILLLILIDGRQPGYSKGATMLELAEIAIRYGAYTVLNFDGGGSTTLAISDEYGNPTLLNSPIHNHMPYWERPIANHLGIYALPIAP